MRTKSAIIVLLICVSAGAACDDGDETSRADAARDVAAGAAATVSEPATKPSVTNTAVAAEAATEANADATAIATAVAADAAQAPTSVPPTTAPTAAAASTITITLERFDCDAYRFDVQSQPEALYKVHWTARSPADGDAGNSIGVQDAEVSQSPGEHAFGHADDDWTQSGSNQLRITAWDAAGATEETTRTIDC